MSQSNEETLKKLRLALIQHDWYYERSDHPTVFRRGEESMRTIQRLVKELGPIGMDLYQAHHRKHFKGL